MTDDAICWHEPGLRAAPSGRLPGPGNRPDDTPGVSRAVSRAPIVGITAGRSDDAA